jgi:translation initiation factor 2 alpha subunit (eIF-2alpha)
MKRQPIIYEDEVDGFAFLTETELAFLHMGDASIKKMLTQRAKMFQTMYSAFKEYQPKEKNFKLLNREEWKKKVYRILNLQFCLKNEQVKGVIDLFFQRVEVPKGGLKGGTRE